MLLVDRRILPQWRLALGAGLFLGATQAVRIDATMFLVAVPVVAAIAWLRADRDTRVHTVLPAIGAFAIGLVPGYTLGLVDLVNHSGTYWNDLWFNERKLVYLSIASVIGSVILVLVWPLVEPLARKLPWRAIATASAVAVVAIGFLAWIVRPRVQTTHGGAEPITGFQAAEHVTIDATRTYYEHSMSWMSWYLGPITVTAAIIGAALLLRALILGRSARVIAPLVVLVPGSAIYLWQADAVADHVWVTRRFLVERVPAVDLARVRVVRVAHPRTVPVALARARAHRRHRRRDHRGRVPGVHDRQRAEHARADRLPLRDRRRVPHRRPARGRARAGAREGRSHRRLDRADDPQLVRRRRSRQPRHREHRRVAAPSRGEWQAQGRQFAVVANAPQPIVSLVPDAKITPTGQVVDRQFLEQTVTHRPRRYQPEDFSLVVATIPTG